MLSCWGFALWRSSDRQGKESHSVVKRDLSEDFGRRHNWASSSCPFARPRHIHNSVCEVVEDLVEYGVGPGTTEQKSSHVVELQWRDMAPVCGIPTLAGWTIAR